MRDRQAARRSCARRAACPDRARRRAAARAASPESRPPGRRRRPLRRESRPDRAPWQRNALPDRVAGRVVAPGRAVGNGSEAGAAIAGTFEEGGQRPLRHRLQIVEAQMQVDCSTHPVTVRRQLSGSMTGTGPFERMKKRSVGTIKLAVRLHQLERHAEVAPAIGNQARILAERGQDVFATTGEINLVLLSAPHECSRHRIFLSSPPRSRHGRDASGLRSHGEHHLSASLNSRPYRSAPDEPREGGGRPSPD